MHVLRLLIAIVKEFLRISAGGTLSNTEVILGVHTECYGADGQLRWRDDPTIQNKPFRFSPGLGLACWWLVTGLAGLVCLFDPLMGSICLSARVTTVGLNALLSSTLANSLTSATWFAGLMKQVASDGAITTGTAVFTSASGTFVSGDIGRQIIVQGAGAAGADLLTTILAVGSTTSITLNNNAGTTVSGARYAFECRLADTMAAHTSFVESVSYSNANRVAWTPGVVAAGAVDNSASVAQFAINASDWIFGAFLVSNNTKSGTTGSLYGAGVNSSGVARQVLSGDTLNVTISATCTAT